MNAKYQNGKGCEFEVEIPPFRPSTDPKRDPAMRIIKFLAQNVARQLVEEARQKDEREEPVTEGKS